jgi:two-component system, cell cycle sensor histidine kinase and response regulator CckA
MFGFNAFGVFASVTQTELKKVMFHRLPLARKLLVIVGVFVAIVICVFFLGVVRSQILRGVRACVGGEGLWSKAEKRAVLSLTEYAETHEESHFQQYLAEIAVPIGDKQARLELQSPSPNMSLVRQGFVERRNNPEDVDSMARLFRRFGHIGYMAQAIAIWTNGDRYIDQLRALSDDLHREVVSSRPDAEKIRQITYQIAAIDAQLTPLEDEFSATLGQGARWIDRLLSTAILLASAVLLLVGIVLSMLVLKQIRNSEEKYRNLINTANDAILVIDPRKRVILEANNKASEMLGFAEQELVGMPESRLYPAKTGEPPQLLTGEASGRNGFCVQLQRSDGTQVPVEVSASATELNGKPVILGIFRDVRERVEAEATVRRSEERFDYLIQNLSDVITVVAVDGTMLYHSPSIERVAGYTPSELLGQNFLSFVHPDDRLTVRAALERLTLRVGSAAPPEYRFCRKDGSWVWLESVGNNLLNDVAVGGIVVTSRDVTTRRGLEEQVRQSQKMEAVGRLAGGIAHDFNNLLMVIQGYAEIVRQEGNVSPEIRKNVDTIVRASTSAANLTRQLLSFSRKHQFVPQVLDLNSLVEQMSEMLLGVLREEMDFLVKLDPEAGSISADPGQIEQVIMNLVVNARDAMPKGGELILETAHIGREKARLGRSSSLPAGDYVMLAVTDTGVGMNAETQSRMFEPFFTTKRKEEGTGLGLSVLYNIVRSFGGHVRVSSEVGRGSTFRIYFPRVSAPAKMGWPELSLEPAHPGKETILVAEDQPDLRWMICQYLQELGYAVLEAKDGGDAVALAEHYAGRIDLLLTDVVMPHIRGSEVARRMLQRRPDMQVIFMSGYTEGEIGAVANDHGSEAVVLQKPFELHTLATKIREVFETRSRR